MLFGRVYLFRIHKSFTDFKIVSQLSEEDILQVSSFVWKAALFILEKIMNTIVQILVNIIIAMSSSIVTFLLTSHLQLRKKRRKLLICILGYLDDIEEQTSIYERTPKEILQQLNNFYIKIQIYFESEISDLYSKIIAAALQAIRISQPIKDCTIQKEREKFYIKAKKYIRRTKLL